jgi:cobalt transporter subunit CbtB
MTTLTNATSQTTTITATRSKTLIAASMAAFLGAFMIWGVGFSHIAAAHNAAHDVRHSNGFPCH